MVITLRSELIDWWVLDPENQRVYTCEFWNEIEIHYGDSHYQMPYILVSGPRDNNVYGDNATERCFLGPGWTIITGDSHDD